MTRGELLRLRALVEDVERSLGDWRDWPRTPRSAANAEAWQRLVDMLDAERVRPVTNRVHRAMQYASEARNGTPPGFDEANWLWDLALDLWREDGRRWPTPAVFPGETETCPKRQVGP